MSMVRPYSGFGWSWLAVTALLLYCILCVLEFQAKEAGAGAGRRRIPGSGRKPVVRVGKTGGETWEANRKMRLEFENRTRLRNEFLSDRCVLGRRGQLVA